MDRYVLRRRSETLIEILYTKFENGVSANVVLKTSGWIVIPRVSGRSPSRTFHPSPEVAISSMRYMPLAKAREAVKGLSLP